jgi:hypothetical protein
MDEASDTRVTLGVIHAGLENMKDSLAEIKQIIGSFKNDYITKEEFAPVKAIAYSLVGLVMTGFIMAVVKVVFAM